MHSVEWQWRDDCMYVLCHSERCDVVSSETMCSQATLLSLVNHNFSAHVMQLVTEVLERERRLLIVQLCGFDSVMWWWWKCLCKAKPKARTIKDTFPAYHNSHTLSTSTYRFSLRHACWKDFGLGFHKMAYVFIYKCTYITYQNILLHYIS